LRLGARLQIADIKYNAQLRYLLVVCETSHAEELEALVPNISEAFASCQDGSIVGVIVAAQAETSGVIYSRFFAPWAGIDEDPVTGSAHSVLAAYFSAKTGKVTLEACQVSQRRGDLTLNVEGQQFVVVRGHATTVMEGTLLVPTE
jgi:PhzF family phenazine biosynthesis protein